MTEPAARAAAEPGGAVGTGAAALAAFALFLLSSFGGLPDEIPLVGAQRVLAGEVPYRDFWTMYAPGQFYLLAALFALFGSHALVSTITGTALSALAVGLAYRLAARLSRSRSCAIAGTAIIAAVFLANSYFGSISSYVPTITLVLAALNLLERHLDGGDERALIWAGLAVGGAALFKHDVGAYTGFAILCGLLVSGLGSRAAPARRGALRTPLIFALAAAAPVLPVVLVLAFVAGYDAFWDTIWFPATIFGDVRGENYPSLLPVGLYHPWKIQFARNLGRYVAFALPVLILLASLPAIAAAARRGNTRRAGMGVALGTAFLLHYYAAHVQINTHIISMTIYAVCLGALALPHAMGRADGSRRSGATGGLAAVVAAGWIAALMIGPAFGFMERRGQERVPLSLAGTATVTVERARAEELAALADFVHRRVPPGQPIHVGLRRHDILVISNPTLYFLLGRPSATRYHELHSGVADTAPVQAEMIRDLQRKNVRLLVLFDPFADAVLDKLKREKRRKQPQIGATALDRFIRANYAPSRRFGEYTVWLRKAGR